MAENIAIEEQNRQQKIRQRMRIRASSKKGILSEKINLYSGNEDEIYNAYSVALAKEKPNSIRLIQPILQHYRAVEWHPVDVLCLLYTGMISVLLLVFHKNVNDWMQILFVNGLLIIATLELLRLASLISGNRFLAFLRVVYPAAFLGWGWNALNSLVPMFFGNYWGTELIIAADKFLFGVHPTVWFQQFQSPWLDELMCVFYTGYYLYMPVIVLSLFFCRKEKEALAVFSLSVFTYFINFICFYLLPTLGPQIVKNLDGFGTNTFSGYYVADLLRQLQENGSVIGAAFPSSHVSGAVIWSLATKRYAPKWGNVLLIFSIGVAISTVYLGYHHGMDPIFGFVLGVCCYKVGVFVLKMFIYPGIVLESQQLVNSRS